MRSKPVQVWGSILSGLRIYIDTGGKTPAALATYVASYVTHLRSTTALTNISWAVSNVLRASMTADLAEVE